MKITITPEPPTPEREVAYFLLDRMLDSCEYCEIAFSEGGNHGYGNMSISHTNGDKNGNSHIRQDINLTEEEFNRLEKFVRVVRKQLNKEKADRMINSITQNNPHDAVEWGVFGEEEI